MGRKIQRMRMQMRMIDDDDSGCKCGQSVRRQREVRISFGTSDCQVDNDR
jgi:hypothetical protein